MTSQYPSVPNPSPYDEEKFILDRKIRNGTNWFYWIAGLSVLNMIMTFTGSSLTFSLGLGITQIIDGFMIGLVRDLGPNANLLRYIGIAIDLVIATIFVLFGFFGRKGYRWPVIIGLVLYTIDGVILLLFQDYLGAAFHALAIYGIWRGLAPVRISHEIGSISDVESKQNIRDRLPYRRL